MLGRTSTRRLIKAVCEADILGGSDLIVSVDRAEGVRQAQSDDVIAQAKAIEWPHGSLDVQVHDAIGLVPHFEWIGELTQSVGSIVLLEDDLLVGPGFDRFAAAALEFAQADPRIAGVSLAAPGYDGYRRLPFEPVDDGFDAIFAQVPWYDGMAFTAEMWRTLRDNPAPSTVQLHAAFDELDDDEWFPDVMRHLVANERWWMLPRSAHATGTGAAGQHFDSATNWFQVPVSAAAPASFRFGSLDGSKALYDDHMEPTTTMLQRLAISHDADGWVMDLGGTRDLAGLTGDQLVLTTRPSDQPVRTWGANMHPLVLNLVYDEPGMDIVLARKETVDLSGEGDRHSLDTLRRHHRLQPTRSEALQSLAPRVGGIVERLRGIRR